MQCAREPRTLFKVKHINFDMKEVIILPIFVKEDSNRKKWRSHFFLLKQNLCNTSLER